MIFCKDCKHWRFVRQNYGECNKINDLSQEEKAYCYCNELMPHQEVCLLTQKDFGCVLGEEK